MILILSDENDISTEQVIDWLVFYQQKFIRINRTDTLKVENIYLNNRGEFDFEINTDRYGRIKYSEISSFWYRRGYLKFVQIALSDKIKKFEFSSELVNYFNSEMNVIVDFIYHFLEKKKSIGSFHHNNLNKLIILDKAVDCGLKIPNSQITTRKNNISKPQKSITKALKEGFFFESKGNSSDFFYTSYTEDLSTLKKIENEFFPSLIQDKLDKLLELRVFYLEEEFYCEAILSQEDKQTAVDFRKYNFVKPNRTVPFQLPREIEQKLSEFMLKIGFNSGSIDMVLDKKLDYYFLEVNPVGQFMQVSKPCNFFLERVIAKKIAYEC